MALGSPQGLHRRIWVKDIIREWPFWSNYIYSLKVPEQVILKIDGRKDNSCLWYTHDYNSGQREHVAVTNYRFLPLGALFNEKQNSKTFPSRIRA